MDKKEKEMLVDVIGAIGWQGFDLAIYEDGSWDYENKNRFRSDTTATYIDLSYNGGNWDEYLGRFKKDEEDYEEEDYEEEDYEDIYNNADEDVKKEMLEAVELKISDEIG